MLSNVGVSIFIFGNKKGEKTGDIVVANGMVEEFEISIKNGTIPIPVGATGFTAHDLWKTVMDDFDKYVGIASLKPLYQDLGVLTKTETELIETVVKIINELTKH